MNESLFYILEVFYRDLQKDPKYFILDYLCAVILFAALRSDFYKEKKKIDNIIIAVSLFMLFVILLFL